MEDMGRRNCGYVLLRWK